MGFSCGIIGLPNVGKSTIFNALTSAKAAASNFPFCTIDPNIGLVEVPDERLLLLAEKLKPPKYSHTTLEFRDIAGLVEGAHQGKGRGNAFLAHIRHVDVVANVVRCFLDPDVVHLEGEVNPIRDMEVLETELILADLQLLERRIERVRRSAKSHDKAVLLELEAIQRLERALNGGHRASEVEVTEEEATRLNDLDLLTRKPFFYIANVGEDDLIQAGPELSAMESKTREEGSDLVMICGKVEAEVLDLPVEERQEYLHAFGLERSGLERLIAVGYRLLDLITFYTVVGRELRAWTVPRGTLAPASAGKIHSDMQRGFIRAEVVSFGDFQRAGSLAKTRETGLARSEGKEYLMQDGDIVTFRFQN